MKRALIITITLVCLSGLILVVVAYHTLTDFIDFLILDELSVIVAIVYTVGNRPYGYIGLDDISVLVFLGWLNVMRSRYLQAHTLILALILLAIACGLLAAAVLNTNNLCDINSDRENDEDTLVMRLGAISVRRYHACLLMGSLVCLALFNLFPLYSLWGQLFLLAAPLLVEQVRYMTYETDPVVM